MKQKIHVIENCDPVLVARYMARPRGGFGISLDNLRNGLDLLSAKKFTVKDTDLTYRELNHWASLGLIDDERNNDSRAWRKLSVRDLLWLRVLKELRDYGLPLEKIKLIYEQHIRRKEEFIGTKFDHALWACYGDCPIGAYLVVLKPDNSLILSLKTIRALEARGKLAQSSLRINLNELYCAIAGKEAYMPKETFDAPNNEESREILAFIESSKDFEEVRLRKQEGKFVGVEKSKRVSGSQRVVDLIGEIKNGQLIITVENGKSVTTLVTKKNRTKK